jgi:hypothetical protein
MFMNSLLAAIKLAAYGTKGRKTAFFARMFNSAGWVEQQGIQKLLAQALCCD